MVTAQDAVHLCQTLAANDIPVWLTGGWGIDALLREQTRPHKDLDILIRLDDVARMRALLTRLGYGLKELWSENRWAEDTHGNETPTAFVLQDADGREVDAHALRFDDQGQGLPAWSNDEGQVFTPEALSGEGLIAGLAVRCLSAEMQRECHTGYELPEVQECDMGLLRKEFGGGYADTPSSPRRTKA